MTTRERLEAKLERRQDWADKRTAKANAVFREAEKYHGDIAFNTQPGHIPERARLIKREERAFGDMQMASHHRGKAFNLSDQLDRSVFSDDADAIKQLEARIAENEATATKYTEINRAWRKSGGDLAALVASGVVGPKLAETIATTMRLCPYLKAPFDTTNVRTRIRSDKERIEKIKRRQVRAEAAEEAGGVSVRGDD